MDRSEHTEEGTPAMRGVLCTALAGLALALSAGAPAETGSLAIYGRFYPQSAWVRTTGATPAGAEVSTLVAPPTGRTIAGHGEVQVSNSRFGFRGSEPLGAGLNAIWQLEYQINVQPGDPLSGRDSYVGLSGGLGTIRLGNLDTVYKTIGDTLSFLGVSSGNFVSDSNVLSKCGIGTGSSCSFHLRRANSVRYDSPALRGLELQLQWSPDEQRPGLRNAYLVSAGASFSRGLLYAALGYEVHRDFFGGSRNVRSDLSNYPDPDARSRDRAVRATVKLDFGAHDLELEAARLEYRETGGAAGKFASHAANHYAASLRSRWGRTFRSQVAYVHAGRGRCALFGEAPCSTEGLEGRQLALGLAYYFSPRTYAHLIGARLWNGHSARYSNLETGDPATGADITQLALGLTTNF